MLGIGFRPKPKKKLVLGNMHDLNKPRPLRRRTGQNWLAEERDLLQVPHFFVGTLQPLKADWKGRPQCVCCFAASVQISLFGLPQGKSPGPHMKDQELRSTTQ